MSRKSRQSSHCSCFMSVSPKPCPPLSYQYWYDQCTEEKFSRSQNVLCKKRKTRCTYKMLLKGVSKRVFLIFQEKNSNEIVCCRVCCDGDVLFVQNFSFVPAVMFLSSLCCRESSPCSENYMGCSFVLYNAVRKPFRK